MRKLRAFFLSRQLREKILMIAFLAILIGGWFSSLNRRAQAAVAEVTATSADLDVHRRWLERRVRIEETAKAAVENLDPSHSYNAVKLNAELIRIAATAGLQNTYQIDSIAPEKTDEFTVNSVSFKANRVSYDKLQRFYDELLKRAPYIGIEQFAIMAIPLPPSDPNNLNVNMRITSVEIAR